MQENPLDDIELMLLAAKDDQEAFAELVKRHQGPLLNFFFRSGVTNNAEDLVQKTFLRLFRYRRRYRKLAKFTTFLYLMARQVWIDDLRKRDRRRKLHEGFKEYLEIGAQNSEMVADDGLSDEVQRALGDLPETMREVVVLGVIQGLEYAEIAEILKIPIGTVKSRMFYALRKMRESLQVDEED